MITKWMRAVVWKQRYPIARGGEDTFRDANLPVDPEPDPQSLFSQYPRESGFATCLACKACVPVSQGGFEEHAQLARKFVFLCSACK